MTRVITARVVVALVPVDAVVVAAVVVATGKEKKKRAERGVLAPVIRLQQ